MPKLRRTAESSWRPSFLLTTLGFLRVPYWDLSPFLEQRKSSGWERCWRMSCALWEEVKFLKRVWMKEKKNEKLPSLSVCDFIFLWPIRGSQIQNKKCFSLHRELLIRFKPGPSTRYFICQLWNITNTWQMFNNLALLCLSLSNNTLLGAWFWEATVQRMWIGRKAACQKREKQLWQKLQNFCELYSSANIQMSLPGRWNH